MRFKQRIKVDLPHPEGPIKAVTRFRRILRLMLNNACLAPLLYQRLNFSTSKIFSLLKFVLILLIASF